MRSWKPLLAARSLFKEPTIVENHLILTLSAEHDSARNVRSVTPQLQNIYKESSPFQKVFSAPKHDGKTIILELKTRYRSLSANAALEKLVGFVIPALAPLSRNEIKANRQAEKQLAIKKALSEGTLFKAVERSGEYVNLIISDKFKHNSNFPVICRALQAYHSENAAFRELFHDIPFSKRKPQLRLKKYEGELNAATLLTFIQKPNTTVLTAVEPEVVQADVAQPEVLQTTVANVTDAGSFDDFFNSLPDLFDDFSDSDSDLQKISVPLLFKYTRPYVSSEFDIGSLLSDRIASPIDLSSESDFEEGVTDRARAITVTM